MITIKKNDSITLIGQPAKKASKQMPDSCFYDAKRMIGKKFNDPELQNDINFWPFKVVSNEQERPVFVHTDSQGRVQHILPELVTAKLLGKIKEAA